MDQPLLDTLPEGAPLPVPTNWDRTDPGSVEDDMPKVTYDRLRYNLVDIFIKFVQIYFVSQIVMRIYRHVFLNK